MGPIAARLFAALQRYDRVHVNDNLPPNRASKTQFSRQLGQHDVNFIVDCATHSLQHLVVYYFYLLMHNENINVGIVVMSIPTTVGPVLASLPRQ